jgi:uncharacterized protein
VTEEARSERLRGPSPWILLVGTVLWTWSLLGMAIASGGTWLAFPTVIATVLGLLGPVIVPSVLIATGRWDDESLRTFWRRSLDPRTLSRRWYTIAAGLVVILVVLPPLLAPQGELGFDAGPLAFIAVGVLAGAAEEPCWRGYGQEALQRRLPVLASALVVGVFWAAWHLPMFMLDGTYQHGLGIGTTSFWTFNAALIVGAPIYAWLYNAAGRVVFSAVWFHALGNLIGELIATEGAEATGLLVGAVVAGMLVATSWRWMRSRRQAGRAVVDRSGTVRG